VSLAEQVKAAIMVRQLVLRHIELTPSGIGLCPFHDDHNPSFNVNDERNFWYCFACNEGGDISVFG
jgi:DNA primase